MKHHLFLKPRRPRSIRRQALVMLLMASLASAGWAANDKAQPKATPKPPSHRELPARDLTVELRQVDDAAGAGYSAGTAQAPAWPAQAVRVRNGEKAHLRVGQSVAVQWVQSVTAQAMSLSSSAPGNASQVRSSGGGVQQGMSWLNSGQNMVLTPRWPGGKEDATVEVELQSVSLEGQSAAGLPRQTLSEWATTVTAPLGYWVIIAATGGVAPVKGSYSSEPGNEVRRTIQVRVTAP